MNTPDADALVLSDPEKLVLQLYQQVRELELERALVEAQQSGTFTLFGRLQAPGKAHLPVKDNHNYLYLHPRAFHLSKYHQSSHSQLHEVLTMRHSNTTQMPHPPHQTKPSQMTR